MDKHFTRATKRWDESIDTFMLLTLNEEEAATRRQNGEPHATAYSDAFILHNGPAVIDEATQLYDQIGRWGISVRHNQLPCLRNAGDFMRFREKREELEQVELYKDAAAILLERLERRYAMAKERSPNVTIVDFKKRA